MSNNIDIVNITGNIVAKKRGRKSKKELELALKEQELMNSNNKKDNIAVFIEETNSNNNSSNEKNGDILDSNCINEILNSHINESNNNVIDINNADNNVDNNVDNNETDEVLKDTLGVDEQKSGIKKRGRKPKGGKIIQQITPLNLNKDSKPNIILHLKCSLKDLQSNAMLDNNIESFTFTSSKNTTNYEIISANNNNFYNCNNTNNNSNINNDNNSIINNYYNKNNNESDNDEYDDSCNDDYNKSRDNDIRDIWKKLKALQYNLHINNISDKKSACFWCTYEFDNPPIYIPKFFMKDSYHVYGCFCSPECATAHLMEENIDSSTKFERYHLINHIYSKIYDYKKNIKPAPNPFYMLDKYYGNLSIQEYRSLLRNERLFLVVDKPLTRILPELHEDNDDFIINNKIIPSNSYQIKKKLQKKQQTKNNILNEKFGMTQ